MIRSPVSIAIVSRDRPMFLRHCLLAVSQLCYHPFEVIVVSDQRGLDAVDQAGLSGRVKSALCNVANISIARNMALELASGELVAFLDDDSVPEPGWLFHLSRAFENADVMAATGYVLGRNGISYQSKAQTIDIRGYTHQLDYSGSETVEMAGTPELAIKTVGTNCMFRRQVFENIGGFDPLFEYYLDESDINIRMAKDRMLTAIVPNAQVHHRSAASEIRQENRVPKTLEQVGCSTAVFLRKHCPEREHLGILNDALLAQHRRLARLVLQRKCKRRELTRILATLKNGIERGRIVAITDPPAVSGSSPKFLALNTNASEPKIQHIVGYRLNGRHARAMATDGVQAGHLVSLYQFSRTSLFHKVRFHPDGYWEQKGGLFGRSTRSDRLFRLYSLEKRAVREVKRVAQVRHPWNIGAVQYDLANKSV